MSRTVITAIDFVFVIVVIITSSFSSSSSYSPSSSSSSSVEFFYFSRPTAASDSRRSRCVLNNPIRTHRTRNKFLCMTGCYRNPNCTGVNSWALGGKGRTNSDLLCREVGSQPYIYIVAPHICTFYKLQENPVDNATKIGSTTNTSQRTSGDVSRADLRKCGSSQGGTVKGITNGEDCSFPFTFRGQLYRNCSQLFQPDCPYLFCLGANRDVLYCFTQSSENPRDSFVQVMSGFAANVPAAPVQVANNWLVVLQRLDAEVSFDHSYRAYRLGFGEVNGNHWLGLSRLSTVTSFATFRLRIEVKFMDDRWISDEYSSFRIGPESTNFKLLVGRYSGDNGDVLNYFRLVGRPFQVKGMPPIKVDTEDDEEDGGKEDREFVNCTAEVTSGWWFGDACDNSLNLNAPYRGQLKYFDFSSSQLKPVSVVRMMVIPRVM